MRPRQFTLKTLLWLMAVVAAFCAGAAVQRGIDDRQTLYYKAEVQPDATERWFTVRASPDDESPD